MQCEISNDRKVKVIMGVQKKDVGWEAERSESAFSR